MRYRIHDILATKTLDASGTEVIDIDSQDPISMLELEYKNTPGSNTMAAHLVSALSKVELVEGSTLLFSLTGRELHALSYYGIGKGPNTHLTNAQSVQGFVSLQYHFGRHLWDPMLALDPKRHKNLQLKVTHNRVTPDASSSAHTLRVAGHSFDEAPVTLKGFLHTVEIETPTMGADGSYNYIDLPLDKVIRMLLIRAHYAEKQPHEVVNEVRLSEDDGKKIPLDISTSSLLKYLNTIYPRWFDEFYAVLTATAVDVYCTPEFRVRCVGTGEAQDSSLDVEGQPLHQPFLLGGNQSVNYQVEVTGFQPHGVFPVLFGQPDWIEDWYDVRKLGNLKLRIKSGSAGTNGAATIMAQSVQAY